MFHVEHKNMTITIGEIELNYEVSGQGCPIILLHGNGEDHRIFDVLIKQLSEKFTVYAIDSRGHGKSTNTKELGYQLMVEDIVKFITINQIEKPILYGFSDGGIIGLLIACHYPTLLSKLIISGANSNPKALMWHWRVWFCIYYFFTRSATIKLMMREPNITKNDLNKIEIPTLVLAGEKDFVKENDTRFIADNIKNATLNILPNEKHGSYVIHSPKLYEIIKNFIE